MSEFADPVVAVSVVTGADVSSSSTAAAPFSTESKEFKGPVSNSSDNGAPKPSSTDSSPQSSTFIHPKVSSPTVMTPSVHNGIKWSIDSILGNITPQDPPKTQIKVLSCDLKTFVLPDQVLQKSSILKNFFHTLKKFMKNVAEIPVVPLQNINAKTLESVIQWCENYDKKPATDGTLAKTLTTLDFNDNFLNDVGISEVFDVASAAVFLNIECLVQFTTRKIDNMMNEQKIKVSQHASFGAQSTSSSPSTSFSFSSPVPTPSQPMTWLSRSAPTVSTTRMCSQCGAQKSCQWRHIQTPNILCNACFIYHRKYGKDRPASAAAAYRSRENMKHNN